MKNGDGDMRDLVTVRDFIRYAATTFEKSGLTFGHGAQTAIGEAIFLVLETLRLPVDEPPEPWFDARLTAEERTKLSALIRARVETRKPAPYLTGRAYIGGVPFHVDERVIVPRSFIGEFLTAEDGLSFLEEPERIERILDLCTGSGCLAILAAYAFPDAAVDAVDLSKDALDVARKNVADHEMGKRISLFHGDLFAPLKDRAYDLIITNPPYVGADDMATLPPEHRHEPEMALASGKDGLDIVRRIMKEAPTHLNKGGGMLCEIGRGREILEKYYPDAPFLWLDTQDSSGEVFWLEKEAA